MAQQLTRIFLSSTTRLRLALIRHEELTGIVFWAASIGFLGALAAVAFREGIRLFELALTGHVGGLVLSASLIPWWERILVPVVGGLLAGLVMHYGARALQARRAVDYMEAIVVGNGVIGARSTLIRSVASLFTIASGGSIGREGPMVQLAALIGSKIGNLVHAPVPRLRLMVACGAAAGITSAYNAPIAGAMFVAEIVMGSIAMESFGPLLVASVTANATIHNFLGYRSCFPGTGVSVPVQLGIDRLRRARRPAGALGAPVPGAAAMEQATIRALEAAGVRGPARGRPHRRRHLGIRAAGLGQRLQHGGRNIAR